MKRNTTNAVTADGSLLTGTERAGSLLNRGSEALAKVSKHFSRAGDTASTEEAPEAGSDAVVTNNTNRFALSYVTRISQRVRAAWKRRQYRLIQRAIRNYSVERHFCSPMYHPIVGPATMRMAMGLADRNKWPFHAKSVQKAIPSTPTVDRIPQVGRDLHEEEVIPMMLQHRVTKPVTWKNQRKQCS